MQSAFSLHSDPNQPTLLVSAGPSKQPRRFDLPACAECRRLKLKCNRGQPCSSCKRRGCAELCLSGVTVSGRTGRVLIPSLQARVAKLCKRVRILQDALEAVAGCTHPLLAADLRALAEDDEPNEDSCPNSARVPQVKEPVVSQLRTPQATPVPDAAGAIDELLDLGKTFPHPLDDDDVDVLRSLRNIKAQLPPSTDVQALLQDFYDSYGSLFSVASRSILAFIFEASYAPGEPQTDLESVHMLAFTFMVFALARLCKDEESEPFFGLAKALFCIRSYVESTSAVTVRCLLLMSAYCRATSRSSAAWMVLGLMSKLAIANNLHRDPAHWGIELAKSVCWRNAFWEAYSTDTLYTFAVQRVPGFNPAYIDCPIPDLDINSSDPETALSENYLLWKYRFISQLVPRVLQETVASTQPTYGALLALDRDVRASWIPQCLMPDRANPLKGPGGVMRFSILLYRELALLLLHRTPLAIALTESPNDPFSHSYSASVLAAFRSALTLTRALRSPGAPRDPCFLQVGFVATTVLGSLALRVPHIPLGAAAYAEVFAMCSTYDTCTGLVPSRIRHWLKTLKGQLLKTHSDDQPCNVAPDWDEFGADDVRMTQRLARGWLLAGSLPQSASEKQPGCEIVAFTELLEGDAPWLQDPIAFNVYQSQAIEPTIPFSTVGDRFTPTLGGQLLGDMDPFNEWEMFLNSIGVAAECCQGPTKFA